MREQFKKYGNIYFLFMGCLMAVGYYAPKTFMTSSVPWTTLGPLLIVISCSLAQEGVADHSRHKNDRRENSHSCVVLRRATDLDKSNDDDKKSLKRVRDMSIREGKDVNVTLLRMGNMASPSDTDLEKGNTSTVDTAFESVLRKDIFPGDLILVRNRDMVPADMILLASSGEKGATYIETSPIDGETNLKLRSSPVLPLSVFEELDEENGEDIAKMKMFGVQAKETIEHAVQRLTCISRLGHVNGSSALDNPDNDTEADEENLPPPPLLRRLSTGGKGNSSRRSIMKSAIQSFFSKKKIVTDEAYVCTLTSEAPNASVNTYSGKLTFPPLAQYCPSTTVPIGADNILLRGAMIRNTEWAIGVACFTGKDTKLCQNAVETPSKFSYLDMYINRTVVAVLFVYLILVLILGRLSTSASEDNFDNLWYAGYHSNTTTIWPYLESLPAPDWDTSPQNYFQNVLTFTTLLVNLVPLSLYVTVEVIILFMMYLIQWDKDMYHEETDTAAEARSPNTVTDLGMVEYVFSDKTGTLTQNVMKFKRCSVDSMIFGAPVAKSAPQKEETDDDAILNKAFHPLKSLVVGSKASTINDAAKEKLTLTFNAEMFLLIMSICHTVVVEEEMDSKIKDTTVEPSVSTSPFKKLLSGFSNLKKNKNRDNGSPSNTENEAQSERSHANTDDGQLLTASSEKIQSPSSAGNVFAGSLDNLPQDDSIKSNSGKSADGAPFGYCFQAESPDDGALVSAASSTFGFQFVDRGSDTVSIRCDFPSLLADSNISSALKDKSLKPNKLALDTASPLFFGNRVDDTNSSSSNEIKDSSSFNQNWSIIAVNKFDSTRKRMSVLVRSPAELGSVPMLLCKGADSSLLHPEVCEAGDNILTGSNDDEVMRKENESKTDEENWEYGTMLSIQAHLGMFASEGLRTLVLGLRILSEEECSNWLTKFELASNSMDDRDGKLFDAAVEIETKLYIVGATAIEDKLQDGVPETIHNIGKAGIKLWVLTGDKRETAVEIGYATKVLTPSMRLTQVAAGKELKVKAVIAKEFLRLVKTGHLTQYQRSSLVEKKKSIRDIFISFGKHIRTLSRRFRVFYHSYITTCCGRRENKKSTIALGEILKEAEKAKANDDPLARMKKVRDLSEAILREYRETDEGRLELLETQINPQASLSKEPTILEDESFQFDSSVTDDNGNDTPAVFNRAEIASSIINSQRQSGGLSRASMRSLTLASMTVKKLKEGDMDDVLSIRSFLPSALSENDDFDKKRASILEKMFAIDPDVRRGSLVKHLSKDKMKEVLRVLRSKEANDNSSYIADENEDIFENLLTKNALVIEGSSLAHILGKQSLEEMLFAVASSCNSVIACRVSPKQKALLVNLVQEYVVPTPVTLAIGDGANDVGMIQEAQLGVGISGLEGTQAVNASDFSIAQFRFLENLLLVHGRWNYIRMSKVVYFSFFKNATLVACLILYSTQSLYSGTLIFSQWINSMFNFICVFPILFLGCFDRDVEKAYIQRNPHLYAIGPNGENLNSRVLARWLGLCIVFSTIFFYLSLFAFEDGGSMTSGYDGLMQYSNHGPGDGEGGGIIVFGTTVYAILILAMGYKVLYECRTIINGEWPFAFTRKDVGKERFWDRLAYSWVGVIWLSLFFFIVVAYVLQVRFKNTFPNKLFQTHIFSHDECYCFLFHYNIT